MDAEKTIKIKSNDSKIVELSSKAALRSGLLRGIIEDYPEDTEFPLNHVNGTTLEKVKEYLTHYQDQEPSIISKSFLIDSVVVPLILQATLAEASSNNGLISIKLAA